MKGVAAAGYLSDWNKEIPKFISTSNDSSFPLDIDLKPVIGDVHVCVVNNPVQDNDKPVIDPDVGMSCYSNDFTVCE